MTLAAASCASDGEDPRWTETSSTALEPAAGGHDSARYQAIVAALRDDLQANAVPGAALAIVEHGQLRFATGIGNKQRGGSDPVSADSLFRIGSITKTFTATLAMQLVAEREVSLDLPITRYLPELQLRAPFDPAQITLRQLLSHTAGLPNYGENVCATDESALSDWFEAHPDLNLWSPPGRLWSYSNLGYSLAGLVLERAAKKPYRALVQERVLEPLGLQSATFDTTAVLAADHALGTPDPQPDFDATSASCGVIEPAGYLWASARELAHFAEIHLADGGGLLDARGVRQMRAPHASMHQQPGMDYGFGWITLRHRGVRLVGHDGGLPGYLSVLLTVPERGFAVVLLVNSDDYDPGRSALAILDQLLELPEQAPEDGSTPPADWTRYVGVYEEATEGFPAPQAGSVAIELEAEHLYLRLPKDGERYALTQIAQDYWAVDLAGTAYTLTFWPGARGRAEYITSTVATLKRATP